MRCATCPVVRGDCLGETVPRLCELARDRDDYRRLLVARAIGAEPPRSAPVVASRRTLDLVSSCPDRGPVLPVSLQPECGCAELSECRAGKGTPAGRVTLRNCLACVEPSAH
jgi:hypothetical protein